MEINKITGLSRSEQTTQRRGPTNCQQVQPHVNGSNLCHRVQPVSTGPTLETGPNMSIVPNIQIFPNNQKKEGAEISQKAQDWFSNEYDGLALSISGMRDPLFPQDALNRFFNSINGINKLPGVDNAGHFLPEWAMEYGEDLINKYIQLREKFLLEKESNEEEIDEDKLNNV